MLGQTKHHPIDFLNLHLFDNNLETASESGFVSFTRNFITIVCPALEKMGFSSSDPVARKRTSSEELNLGSSSESLTAEPEQTLFKKLVKLREKIITDGHFGLKKRFSPKRKRCVSFADDKGLPLEDVRVVDEKDDDYTESAASTAPDSTKTDLSLTPWIMAFFQPIFNKRKMRAIFSEKGVALETVDVEDTRLSGTIKVNCASKYRKVFIRYSKDSWKTYEDVTASEVPIELDRSRAETEVIYSFELNIPESVLHIQFAVCLSDTRGHHWDDNEGSNYILLHHSCLEDNSDSEPETTDDSTKL